MSLGSRIYGQFASMIPVIRSSDIWSILAGPDVDDVSGTQCNPVHLYLDAADGHESTTKRVCEQKRRFLILAAALSNELDILLKSTQITLLLFLVQ